MPFYTRETQASPVDILQVKSIRQVEVRLDSGTLPRPPDRIADLQVYLRAVKRPSALVHLKGSTAREVGFGGTGVEGFWACVQPDGVSVPQSTKSAPIAPRNCNQRVRRGAPRSIVECKPPRDTLLLVVMHACIKVVKAERL